MKKYVLFTLALIFVFSGRSVSARITKDSIYVYGRVVDSFTYELLNDVKVEVMRSDSTLIAELITSGRFLFDGNEANIARVGGLVLPRGEKCIFRYSKKGYQTLSSTYKCNFLGADNKQ